MKLTIKNLGALKEAEIDLSKDLILLCGHNNTGKTYVAYAIYEFLRDEIKPFFEEHNNLFIETKHIIETLNESIEIDLIGIYESNRKLFTDEINDSKKGVESKEKYFKNIEYKITLPSIKKFRSVFLTAKVDLKMWIGNHTILTARKDKDKSLVNFDLSNLKYDHKKQSKNFTKEEIVNNSTVRAIIYMMILGKIGIRDEKRIKIFTSERAAINIFSKELALNKNQFFDKILKTKGEDRTKLLNFAEENINRYQKPIADELLIAEDLLNLSKQKSDFEFLAIELEKSILEGKISVGQYGGLQYQPNFYKNEKNENKQEENVVLEIYQTSSLVKSLASLVFYLRHSAKKNDCIIIDEPELNLHPDNQVLVARFLARLVNEGFKVVASTHSDYIIRELNNLLMLNNSFGEKEELMQKYEYNKNELLTNQQVGAYYFQKGKNTAVPVPLLKRGIEIDSINDVITDLNERSDDIYYTFLESDENIAAEKEEEKIAQENLKSK